MDDVRIIVAIDFGTTYSGFAYVHKENPETVVINSSWPGREGISKTPTALLYDDGYKNVISWGNLALEEEPDEVSDDTEELRPRPVELFKLHISNLRKMDKPWLPPQLQYTKAIEDYLTQMRILIQETIERRWPTVRFPQQVDFVLTIPAEWPPHTTKVMRGCAFNAGLLSSLNSQQLEFTTEPEAAALHCLSVIKEHNLQPYDSFLVADCGGGTVDLTLRKLLPQNRLSEITERVGDLCGSTFVDKEFLHWLGRKVGFQALAKLKSNNYGQMQHLVQRFFCTRIKFKFSGEPSGYRTLKLNLHSYCPSLSQYVVDDFKEQMEEVGWVLKVDYDSVKEMFDPVIDRIINLIDDQLKNSSDEKCSAMFLVGGFSESPYLFRRVKETFEHQVPIIAVPALPIAAIVRGAITYGLNIDLVNDRILKWTYGIEVCRPWVSGDDINNRTSDGMYLYFYELAKRGRNAEVNQKFSGDFYPIRPDQDVISFNVYYTSKHDAKYCRDPGMRLLGVIRVRTHDTHLGLNRPIEFSLTFGKMEIKATAINKLTREIYEETTFELDL
ncbi:hypothetical protein GLOIN_2v1646273 [Rhizophagus clarus]|nr:hypothetical protein GLOIN_2v1646273 [Rhizophagus clarus]